MTLPLRDSSHREVDVPFWAWLIIGILVGGSAVLGLIYLAAREFFHQLFRIDG